MADQPSSQFTYSAIKKADEIDTLYTNKMQNKNINASARVYSKSEITAQGSAGSLSVAAAPVSLLPTDRGSAAVNASQQSIDTINSLIEKEVFYGSLRTPQGGVFRSDEKWALDESNKNAVIELVATDKVLAFTSDSADEHEAILHPGEIVTLLETGARSKIITETGQELFVPKIDSEKEIPNTRIVLEYPGTFTIPTPVKFSELYLFVRENFDNIGRVRILMNRPSESIDKSVYPRQLAFSRALKLRTALAEEFGFPRDDVLIQYTDGENYENISGGNFGIVIFYQNITD